jgi:cold shock CspA family protein
VQATVYRFDPNTGSGAVLTDQGAVLAFDVEALRLSGLRHLRPGQRLSVELAEGGRIAQLTLGTIGSTLRDDQSRS